VATLDVGFSALSDKEKEFITVSKAEYILFDTLENGSMILHNELNQETHFLNFTASLVFSLCDGGKVGEILSNFINKINLIGLNVTEKELTLDFYEILKDFKNKGIAEVSGKL
jgi:hypothetical protein